MSAKAVATLAKPKMRGLLTDQIKKNLVVATVLSFSTMLSYKFLVADKRKIAYAEFYR
jgi:cytochrome c oxidase subunit 6c